MGSSVDRTTGLLLEAYRLRLLRGVEELLADAGLPLVAGVDEAGRGCLAGPVVAAAVVVDPSCLIPGVDDSKKLKAGERDRLGSVVRRGVLAYTTSACSAGLIDRGNILEATRRAMRSALLALPVQPDVALIDAVPLRELPYPSLPLVRGDAFSFAIACASIIAKTERDRLMCEFDQEYPGYGFAEHKGYASRTHRRVLEELGPTPLHRLTFRSVIPRVGEERSL